MDPPHNDPRLNAASNFIIWHQPPASFLPKFPTHDYIPCKPTVEMPSTLLDIDSFKLFFQKVCVHLLPSVQTKELTSTGFPRICQQKIPYFIHIKICLKQTKLQGWQYEEYIQNLRTTYLAS